jgi:hypothetical protein
MRALEGPPTEKVARRGIRELPPQRLEHLRGKGLQVLRGADPEHQREECCVLFECLPRKMVFEWKQ